MTKQFLTFNINGQSYGFAIEKVREIKLIGEITKIPNAPPHYTGVMNLRGAIISVVSIRTKMGLPLQESTTQTCTIVVDCGGRQVATVVDAVQSVVDIEDHQIEKNSVARSETSFIDEIAKLENKIVMLIDIEKLLFEGTPQNLALAG